MNKDKVKTALYQASMHACFLMLEAHNTPEDRSKSIEDNIDNIISEFEWDEEPLDEPTSNNVL